MTTRKGIFQIVRLCDRLFLKSYILMEGRKQTKSLEFLFNVIMKIVNKLSMESAKHNSEKLSKRKSSLFSDTTSLDPNLPEKTNLFEESRDSVLCRTAYAICSCKYAINAICRSAFK